MRKTTTKLLAGSVALVAFAAPLACWAGSQDGVLSMLLGAASLGDDGRSATKQADALLREARQAMAAGDHEAAEARISQAEALHPKYPPLHLGDSPKKARAALEKLVAKKAGGDRRGGIFGQANKSANPPSPDPFLSRQPNSVIATDVENTGNKKDAENLPGVPSANPWMNNAASPGRAGPTADTALVGSRYAGANAAVGPTLPNAAAPNAPALNYPRKTELGGNADELQRGPLNYGPAETQPNPYGQHLSSAKQNGPDIAMPPRGQARPSDTGGAPELLPLSSAQVGALPPGGGEKQRAIELTKQARAALARGDLPAAEQLARQAMPLAPDTAYRPQDDRPALVLLEIQKAKQNGGNQAATGGNRAAGDTRYPAAQALYLSGDNDSPNARAVGQSRNSVYNSKARLTQNIEPPALESGDARRPIDSVEPTPEAGTREGIQWSRESDDARRLIDSVEPIPEAGIGEGLKPMDSMEPTPEAGTGEGLKWYGQGVDALARGNTDEALQAFRRAYAFQAELDAVTRQRLQDHLQALGAQVDPTPSPGDIRDIPSPTTGTGPNNQVLARQVFAEVARQQSLARDMREKQPKQAFELLQRTKEMVESVADLEPASREQLLRRLDMSIDELEQYISQNSVQIDLDERNREVEDEIERAREQKVEIEERLAYMVNDFRKLVDEQRYAEAQVLAKRAAELAPDNPLALQLPWMARFLERNYRNDQVLADKENGFWQVLQQVDEAAVPFDGDIAFPDVRTWDSYRKSKYRQRQEGQFRRTPRELEIEQRLSTPVSLKFQERPLAEVIAYLGKIAQIPVYLDPQGMAAEGVTSDTPVTIDLTQDISLKSALMLILEPLRLSYIVKDEVLKITSEDQRRGQLYEVVYPVADLVIPIPNFAPNGREGINAAFREAYQRMGWAGAAGGSFGWSGPNAYFAANEGGANVDPKVLAQIPAGVVPVGGGGPPQTGMQQSIPFGPGGLSGGSQADFDPLIDLITRTVATQTWDELGGPGTIEGFETTLSLVVSQTQEVHEEIADLLTQLRRLQDLQVTIEVRFITLRDDFFERIGVDFDFNLGTHTNLVAGDLTDEGPPPSFGGNVNPSAIVGLTPDGTVTPGQDIQFRQDSFADALPQFGGFDPLMNSAATFGFAILSDIEAYFLVAAAQGDTRSNILQAPKVTLFNGQQATVSDTTQRPFVISVTPVVGDFAAAQQPVIVVLSEGTSMTVQAVVSENRRFVRLTVVPFFSQIGEVEEFTFEGETTTKKSSSEDKKGDDEESKSEEEEETTSGTTVQLPEFSFVSVTTTVSVPDGGTVLLGGIKRLSEGRTERGVPILSKMPYINRLFRNVGIGRETSSLMMMVTPRIIIQEEEEENLLGTAPAP